MRLPRAIAISHGALLIVMFARTVHLVIRPYRPDESDPIWPGDRIDDLIAIGLACLALGVLAIVVARAAVSDRMGALIFTDGMLAVSLLFAAGGAVVVTGNLTRGRLLGIAAGAIAFACAFLLIRHQRRSSFEQ
jgi:hypothetical protein